jgi:hypothetical protein
MGTITAQIIIGNSHSYHGGIIPSHFILLSENDRPAWILINPNIFEKPSSSEDKIIWIPSRENMLEDALLMIAIHVIKNKAVTKMAEKYCSDITGSTVEIDSSIEKSQRRELYEKCRSLKHWPKCVISVFHGSTIKKQLEILKEYSLDFELCVSK